MNKHFFMNDKELLQLFTKYQYQSYNKPQKSGYYKVLNNKDIRSPFAFTIVAVVFDTYTLRIEGLNEPRIERALQSGIITLKSKDDLEQLWEVIYENTYDELEDLPRILDFFELQLISLHSELKTSDSYKNALKQIELLVDKTNEMDFD